MMRVSRTLRSSEVRIIAAVVTIDVGSYTVAQLVMTVLDPRASRLLTDAIEVLSIVLLSTTGLWWMVIRGLREQHRRQHFDQQVQSALQMAPTEDGAYDVVRRALAATGVQGHAQLKLADSSEAHLKVSVDHVHGPEVAPCEVVSPFDCPAIRRAQTSVFASAQALDACPWLVKRQTAADGADVGAVCVPLNSVGRSIGVLHIAARQFDLPSDTAVRDVEVIAERAGMRLGVLRVMSQTHLQAATDPLTGLLNRRSLENQVHDLLRSQTPFCIAMGDLDHFKKLNDTHGHDAGDRALRVFARTARAALRADDIISRYGGEEFVFVFPDLSSQDTGGALERLREALALEVNAGRVPAFTASFGVAHSGDADGIEELLRIADSALFQAKRDGRNRVVIDRGPRPAIRIAEPAPNPLAPRAS